MPLKCLLICFLSLYTISFLSLCTSEGFLGLSAEPEGFVCGAAGGGTEGLSGPVFVVWCSWKVCELSCELMNNNEQGM